MSRLGLGLDGGDDLLVTSPAERSTTMSPLPTTRIHSAVLALNEQRAEWLDLRDPARPRFGSAEVLEEGPAGLAQAAMRAFDDAGGGSAKPKFVLALGAGLLKQRLLQLPELSRKDRARVLERKAHRLWADGADPVLFSARLVDQLGQADVRVNGTRATWLLSVASDRQTSELCTQLSRQGFHVNSALALRSAAWNHAAKATGASQPFESNDESASIIVSVYTDATTVALVAGTRFITRYELKGDFYTSPSLGSSLLQDIRNSAGFWRKVSRGGSIDKIDLVGLDERSADSLKQSLQTVLSEVPVRSVLHYPDSPDAEKIERLLACLVEGPFQAELKLRTPASRKRTGQCLVGVAAAALCTLGVVRIDASSEAIELSALNETLRDGVQKLESEGQLHREEELRAERVLEHLHAATAELEGGIPFHRLMTHIARAFEGRATLQSASVGRGEKDAVQLALHGSFDSGPLGSMDALRAIGAELELCDLVGQLRILPFSNLQASGDGSRVGFTIRAELKVRAQ